MDKLCLKAGCCRVGLVLSLLFVLAACSAPHVAARFPVVAATSSKEMSLGTPAVTSMLSSTPTPALTETPEALLLPGSTPEQFALDEEIADRAEIEEFLFEQYLAVADIIQLVDADGDGQPEILAHSGAVSTSQPFFAILRRSGEVWEEALFVRKATYYCDDVRTTVEAEQVVVDFLACGGGTGILSPKVERHWIRCNADQCSVVWSAQLARTFRGKDKGKVYRRYEVAEIEQPDMETVVLTTRRFGIIDLPTADYLAYAAHMDIPFDTTRRLVGPDTVETFRWDGQGYQLEDRTQTASEWVVVRESDLLTEETLELVYDLLHERAQQPSGYFEEGFGQTFNDVWGLTVTLRAKGSPWWGWSNPPDAAAHNGPPDELGEWIASLVAVKERLLCAVTLQRYSDGNFTKVEQFEVPCTVNFSRLAWRDVTGDGNDELLLRTIPPIEDTEETGAGLQRLYIYSVADGVVALAVIDGAVNGPDGAGVYWEDADGDGVVEILAGLPVIDLEDRIVPLVYDRQFEVYRWDALERRFVLGDVRIVGATE